MARLRARAALVRRPALALLLCLPQTCTTLVEPHLTEVRTIVDDPLGHVRDCAPPLQDVATGHWHMWCNWVSIAAPSQICWNCTVRHYCLNTSDLADTAGIWRDHGDAVGASEPWDSAGTWAPGVIEEGGVWSLFYCTTTLAKKTANEGGECIGLAQSRSPFGPWAKWPRPIACNTEDGARHGAAQASGQRAALGGARHPRAQDAHVGRRRCPRASPPMEPRAASGW